MTIVAEAPVCIVTGASRGIGAAIALAFAGSAVAGQNYGAKLPARVRETYRASTVIAVSLSIVLMLPMLLMPTPMFI